MNTPILFLIFNRPETTARVFEVIRQVKPKFLFIAADGPRNDDEYKICLNTKNIVFDSIDWECEVKTLFREENLGCGRAVSGAITWFFDQVEMGIILEDDCLPNISFFLFCTELLEKYKDDQRIGHIRGNLPSGEIHIKDDYFFSRLPFIWGWATWRDRWKYYNYEMQKEDLDIFISLIENKISKDKSFVNSIKKDVLLIIDKELDTWDYQWFYTITLNNYFAISPKYNLVQNIGFIGLSSRTNTINTNKIPKWLDQEALSLALKFHPSEITYIPEWDITQIRLIYPGLLVNIYRFIINKLRANFF